MKSPWKFITQLVSRRGPPETPGGSVGHDADAMANENTAQRASAPAQNPTEAPRRSEHGENRSAGLVATASSDQTEPEVDTARVGDGPGNVEEAQAPARQEVSRSSAEAHPILPESETGKKPPRTTRAKKPGHAKNSRTDVIAQSDAVVNSDQNARSSSSGGVFFDEVLGLDDEIQQLRIQLARKLHLQNVQLKKMLERFDIS